VLLLYKVYGISALLVLSQWYIISWEPERRYCCTKCMALRPFWFSTDDMEHYFILCLSKEHGAVTVKHCFSKDLITHLKLSYEPVLMQQKNWHLFTHTQFSLPNPLVKGISHWEVELSMVIKLSLDAICIFALTPNIRHPLDHKIKGYMYMSVFLECQYSFCVLVFNAFVLLFIFMRSCLLLFMCA